MRLVSLQSNADVLQDKYISLLEFGETVFRDSLIKIGIPYISLLDLNREKLPIMFQEDIRIIDGIIKEGGIFLEKVIRDEYKRKNKDVEKIEGTLEYFDYIADLYFKVERYKGILGVDDSKWQNRFNLCKAKVVAGDVEQFLERLSTNNNVECVFFHRRRDILQSWDKMQNNNIFSYKFDFNNQIGHFVFTPKEEGYSLENTFEIYISKSAVGLREDKSSVYQMKGFVGKRCRELLTILIPEMDRQYEGKGGFKDELYEKIKIEIEKERGKRYADQFSPNLYREEWAEYMKQNPSYKERLSKPGNRHINKWLN